MVQSRERNVWHDSGKELTMTSKNIFAIIVTALTLTACGGGTPSQTIDNVVVEKPEPATGTASIVAAEDFTFKVDIEKTISVNTAPTEEGIVRIYSTYEHFDANTGDYYPDPHTLLASFSPSQTSSFDFQMLEGKDYVVVEFTPASPSGVSTYRKIDIGAEKEILVDF